MLDEAHLRANLDAVEHPRFSAEQLAAFAAMAGKSMVNATAA
jgi:hypothetical protein